MRGRGKTVNKIIGERGRVAGQRCEHGRDGQNKSSGIRSVQGGTTKSELRPSEEV